jgi:hypothetical protein
MLKLLNLSLNLLNKKDAIRVPFELTFYSIRKTVPGMWGGARDKVRAGAKRGTEELHTHAHTDGQQTP